MELTKMVNSDTIAAWLEWCDGSPKMVLVVARLLALSMEGLIGDELYDELIGPLLLSDDPYVLRYGVDPRFAPYYMRAIAAGVSEVYIRAYEKCSFEEQNMIFEAYARGYSGWLIDSLVLRHRTCLNRCFAAVDELLAAGYEEDVLGEWLRKGVTVGNMVKHLLPDGNALLTEEMRDERISRLVKQASKQDFSQAKFGDAETGRSMDLALEFADVSKKMRKRVEKYLEDGRPLDVVHEVVRRRLHTLQAEVLFVLKAAGVDDAAVDLMLSYMDTDAVFANAAVQYAEWVVAAHIVDVAAGRREYGVGTLVYVVLHVNGHDVRPLNEGEMSCARLLLLDRILESVIPGIEVFNSVMKASGSRVRMLPDDRFAPAYFGNDPSRMK